MLAEHENHFVVQNKKQLRFAVLAGAYPTFEEARANPFSVRIEGTPFGVNFKEGLHERDAKRIAAHINRTPALVFSAIR